MRRPPSAAELQRRVDTFNRNFAVGQEVDVVKDDKSTVRTKTTSAAEVLSGHSAVVWLEGIRGCYMLDRVTPVEGKS